MPEPRAEGQPNDDRRPDDHTANDASTCKGPNMGRFLHRRAGTDGIAEATGDARTAQVQDPSAAYLDLADADWAAAGREFNDVARRCAAVLQVPRHWIDGLVQDAWVAAHRDDCAALRRAAPKTSLAGWCMGTLRNLVRERKRKRAESTDPKRSGRRLRSVTPRAADAGVPSRVKVRSWADDPEAPLTQAQRAAIRAWDDHASSASAAAASLGISRQAYLKRLGAALARLAAWLRGT